MSYYTEAMRSWMGGYQPILGDEMGKQRSISEVSRKSSEARIRQADAGKGWGAGTIEGLGSSDALPGKAQIKRSSNV